MDAGSQPRLRVIHPTEPQNRAVPSPPDGPSSFPHSGASQTSRTCLSLLAEVKGLCTSALSFPFSRGPEVNCCVYEPKSWDHTVPCVVAELSRQRNRLPLQTLRRGGERAKNKEGLASWLRGSHCPPAQTASWFPAHHSLSPHGQESSCQHQQLVLALTALTSHLPVSLGAAEGSPQGLPNILASQGTNLPAPWPTLYPQCISPFLFFLI